ncbi:hypothetical protein G6M89_08410 [Natronolimnobius sp. AArcel1]|uniref:hypothetical protein n=1 Tax=Natronolimnobius sp. AArcel1 TaxID=1679093 RepID=UPI0013EA2798|nr:hypothetical protein [Natronolimnobius sp. AArcel1]NGM69034.1 hypothetical protein [Natronolimnobius sp. AArcel1]
MESNPTRRRLLQLGGVGATASLAGCSQFDIPGSEDDSESEPQTESEAELEADTEPDIDPADGITAVVQPDQEALQQAQQEVMAELEEGDLDEQEAQMELQQRQVELISSHAAEFESSMSDDDEVSIEAGVAQEGALLIDGPDERLMSLLRDGDVSGLMPGAEYGRMLEQQEQQQPPVDAEEGGEEPVEEEPVDEDDADDETADGDDSTDEDEAGDEDETDDADE